MLLMLLYVFTMRWATLLLLPLIAGVQLTVVLLIIQGFVKSKWTERRANKK